MAASTRRKGGGRHEIEVPGSVVIPFTPTAGAGSIRGSKGRLRCSGVRRGQGSGSSSSSSGFDCGAMTGRCGGVGAPVTRRPGGSARRPSGCSSEGAAAAPGAGEASGGRGTGATGPDPWKTRRSKGRGGGWGGVSRPGGETAGCARAGSGAAARQNAARHKAAAAPNRGSRRRASRPAVARREQGGLTDKLRRIPTLRATQATHLLRSGCAKSRVLDKPFASFHALAEPGWVEYPATRAEAVCGAQRHASAFWGRGPQQ